MDTYFLQDARGQRYPITGLIRIGRAETCQLILAGKEVSRLHASLWVEHGVLYVRDENTSNGTFVNGRRIQPRQPVAIGHGHQIQVGKTQLVVVSASQVNSTLQPVPAPRQTKPHIIWFAVIAAVACLVVAALAGFWWWNQSTAHIQTSPGLTIVSTAPPPQLLTARDFAAADVNLALSITRLNNAELAFILATQTASTPQTLDTNLLEVAAQAMNVALLAEMQAQTILAQPGDRLASAQNYFAVARLGYALVLEVHNLRQGLQGGAISSTDAAQSSPVTVRGCGTRRHPARGTPSPPTRPMPRPNSSPRQLLHSLAQRSSRPGWRFRKRRRQST